MKLVSLTAILLLFITATVLGQKAPVIQYSSFCEGGNALGGPGSYRERIKEISRNDTRNLCLTAIVIRDCGLPIVPIQAIANGDTLFVNTGRVQSTTFNLTNGEKVTRWYEEEDCLCAYEFRLEVALDTVSVIYIDGRLLERTDEKYVTVPIHYFTFNGDTTAYADKYGKRHGAYVIKKNDHLLKTIYKNGNLVGCELLSLDGKLIRSDKDCYSLIGRE